MGVSLYPIKRDDISNHKFKTETKLDKATGIRGTLQCLPWTSFQSLVVEPLENMKKISWDDRFSQSSLELSKKMHLKKLPANSDWLKAKLGSNGKG